MRGNYTFNIINRQRTRQAKDHNQRTRLMFRPKGKMNLSRVDKQNISCTSILYIEMIIQTERRSGITDIDLCQEINHTVHFA